MAPRTQLQQSKRKIRALDALDGEHRLKLPRKEKLADPSAHRIATLEKEIRDSQKSYNHIAELISIAATEIFQNESSCPAIVSLCRVFCRLFVDRRMTKAKEASRNESIILNWLKDRYEDYRETLVALLHCIDAGKQVLAVALSMRLVQEELAEAETAVDQVWQTGTFSHVLRHLLEVPDGDTVLRNYVEKYTQQFDDVRHWTFTTISSVSIVQIGLENV